MAEQRDIVKDLTDISHVVRDRRRELRLRFEDVAKMAGVSRHLVSSIEKGDPSDQIEKLLRVLEVLQIKVDLRRSAPRHVEPPVDPRPARTRQTPAVPLSQIHREPGRILCLDCGAAVRSLNSHVRQQHGLSMAGYRQRWNIDEDVPLRPVDARSAS